MKVIDLYQSLSLVEIKLKSNATPTELKMLAEFYNQEKI